MAASTVFIAGGLQRGETLSAIVVGVNLVSRFAAEGAELTDIGEKAVCGDDAFTVRVAVVEILRPTENGRTRKELNRKHQDLAGADRIPHRIVGIIVGVYPSSRSPTRNRYTRSISRLPHGRAEVSARILIAGANLCALGARLTNIIVVAGRIHPRDACMVQAGVGRPAIRELSRTCVVRAVAYADHRLDVRV